MANNVIKRDGSKEPFNTEKIKNSIRAAAERTEVPEDKLNEIVEKVSASAISMASGKEEVSTVELKDKILSELDLIEPSISAEWRRYDQEKGKP